MLGRRKHERYLLSEPVEASLRLREEVSVERWGDGEVVVLSPEPLKPDERLALEVPGGARPRLNVRVSESRPAVSEDGAIRYRLVLSIEAHAADITHGGGHES
jgi:hypothetical protein